MTPDAALDDRQSIYGFSEQSSVQMMYSPVMYKTDDNSIRMEQISHIKAQIGVSNDNPNMCPDEEASKPSIESFESVEPGVICSKLKATEEEHMDDGKGTVTDAAEDSDVKAPRLMKFIEIPDPKDAKPGLRIQFMHNEGEGTVYWLEVTKE